MQLHVEMRKQRYRLISFSSSISSQLFIVPQLQRGGSSIFSDPLDMRQPLLKETLWYYNYLNGRVTRLQGDDSENSWPHFSVIATNTVLFLLKRKCYTYYDLDDIGNILNVPTVNITIGDCFFDCDGDNETTLSSSASNTKKCSSLDNDVSAMHSGDKILVGRRGAAIESLRLGNMLRPITFNKAVRIKHIQIFFENPMKNPGRLFRCQIIIDVQVIRFSKEVP